MWLDDDISGYVPALDWLASLPEDSHLAVSPSSRVGLTPGDLDRVEAFLARAAGATLAK